MIQDRQSQGMVWLVVYYLHTCYTPVPPEGGYTVLPLSVQDIFRRIFLSNYWWQKSDIWSQASYRYAILLEAFLDPSDSYFLFADLVGFYTHWTYMQGYHKWALAHSSSCCNWMREFIFDFEKYHVTWMYPVLFPWKIIVIILQLHYLLFN